jgi:hypothetical protein
MTKIIRKEVRKRGFFGWVFLLIFLGFNVLMLVWLLDYWVQVGGLSYGSEAERVGHGVGVMLGTSMLALLWMAGAVILGLLTLVTRGRKTYIEETAHSDHAPR